MQKVGRAPVVTDTCWWLEDNEEIPACKDCKGSSVPVEGADRYLVEDRGKVCDTNLSTDGNNFEGAEDGSWSGLLSHSCRTIRTLLDCSSGKCSKLLSPIGAEKDRPRVPKSIGCGCPGTVRNFGLTTTSCCSLFVTTGSDNDTLNDNFEVNSDTDEGALCLDSSSSEDTLSGGFNDRVRSSGLLSPSFAD